MQHTLHLPVWTVRWPVFQKEWMPQLSFWMIVAGFLVMMTTTAALASMMNTSTLCFGDDVLLSYARYNKLGEVAERTYRCGTPHMTCKIRNMTADEPVYDCSMFMLPKGTISWE